MDAPFDCPEEVLNALGRSLREPPSPSTLDSDAGSWTADIEKCLEDLLLNCQRHAEAQRRHVFYIQYRLQIFQLPVIILSSINSVLSVGLSAYLAQNTTSVINCLISLIIACLGSVQLFLGLTKKLEIRLQSYNTFKQLAIKIASTTKLEAKNRVGTGPAFLADVLAEYKAGIDNALLHRKPFDDVFLT